MRASRQVGTGKLPTPPPPAGDGPERRRDGDADADAADDDRLPLTPCEIVSELLYGGKSMLEIAGYTPYVLRDVLGLRRDDGGRLVRGSGLPPWVKVDAQGHRVIAGKPMTYAAMYAQVRKNRGATDEEVAAQWQHYVLDNPSAQLAGQFQRFGGRPGNGTGRRMR